MSRGKKISFSIILILLLFYFLYKISGSRDFQFFSKPIKNQKTSEKIVALTFDDGPTEYTKEILDILDQLNIKATFFLIGNEMKKYPNETKSIISKGHQVGNHTYTHKRMVLKSLGFIKEEIDLSNQIIKDMGYNDEIVFRPPYFKKLFLLPYYLKSKNMKTILADVEPETALGFNSSAEKYAKYTIDNTKNGSIILLHIMYKSRIEARKSITDIVLSLKKQGYTFVTVNELLDSKP